ncbi:hypothetical protein [Vibrio sp. ZF 223]|uniref:hypothetical protein n=1 Tax=Vibrio sp. ZF 223 TaxID=2056191 RepID=UPI0015E7B181|nr:hypothetical protein [Vibrio sp. ZF 223]
MNREATMRKRIMWKYKNEKLIKSILLDRHVESLKQIAEHNYHEVAQLLARSFCAVEHCLKIQLNEADVSNSLSEIFELFYEGKQRSLTNEIPSFSELVIDLYRDAAIPELGGYQTPLTIGEIDNK